MYVVAEPSAHTEFEVQALLYTALRQLGFNVRGEVRTSIGNRAQCRFDLAEFSDGKLAGIIEVKSAPITHKTSAGWNGTRQGRRYGLFGVPVLVVYGMRDAEQLIARVESTGSLWGEQ
jgi:hypothetical protein